VGDKKLNPNMFTTVSDETQPFLELPEPSLYHINAWYQ
jgi:hypothetical protein